MPEQPPPSSVHERLSQLEAELRALRTPAARRRGERSRVRRIFTIIGLAASITLLPMVAVASDTFTDVPNGHTFHAEINNLYNARITAGCVNTPPLAYCPDSAVTRGQMAGFLNRGLGRATYSSFGSVALTGTEAALGSVTVKAGTVTGGTAFVKIDVSFGLWASSLTGCPCEGYFYLDAGGRNYRLQLTDLVGTYAWDVGSATAVVAIPTGVAQTFTFYGNRSVGTGSINAYGEMTAMTAAFAGQGGSTLGSFGDEVSDGDPAAGRSAR